MLLDVRSQQHSGGQGVGAQAGGPIRHYLALNHEPRMSPEGHDPT